MKKIYFLIFADHLKSKVFSLHRGNPGVGGTQFTSIRLALLLAETCPEWKIVLVNSNKISLENSSLNVVQQISKNSTNFFNSIDINHDDLIIASTSTLKTVDIKCLQNFEGNLVCWSRHPFDKDANVLASKVKFKGVVCVGTYQFYSNTNITKDVFYIQNPFILPNLTKIEKKLKPKNREIDIVYMGALIPGKGFLEVAKSWHSLKALVPRVKLHVIGSTATYGEKSESHLIPTKPDFAEKILGFIPEEDIHSGKVIFYGNLGEEKFEIIQKCDLAILNPTGNTEAFPASPLECMACGIPVIASDDYGMSDCMRFFPELVIKGNKDIPKKVEWLISDPLRYQELQQRSVAVAKWFDSQADQIITRWVRLIEAIISDKNSEVDLSPILPFYGSRIKMFYRKRLRAYVNKIRGLSG
ncbi:glycosyltransferase [Nodosilinea sp. P-1105]|uniref:glycosyltransferase family 4 protein n=1 Tax=Nodosilinea sp. P-1105 TaxID=2546229 RepID=UPI00146A49F6|nr:glycosyltransferase [Nodosilinea sp. P-1105]NMF83034.1 glycosyltransferase family 1 protein [Nodosilinea sp. P-1105]